MEINKIQYKKPFYPIRKSLRNHLNKYVQNVDLPIDYGELLNYTDLIPVVDDEGNDTLWYSVLYAQSDLAHFQQELTRLYHLLMGSGYDNPYLKIGSIEFCSFGNSKPFRIKIVNEVNDNYDFFYIKRADSSRIFGLELEDIFSPDKVSFLVGKDTVLEQHIVGIPVDAFILKNKNVKIENRLRFAKEFVKFNERCFTRLLGDMRAYNFVVEIIQDFDNVQYRLRAIDFDQQSYEGRKSIYLPQYYKENIELVNLASELLSKRVAEQYVREERLAMKKRFAANKARTKSILSCMRKSRISSPENIIQLSNELAKHHDDARFTHLTNMGDVLTLHLENQLGIVIY